MTPGEEWDHTVRTAKRDMFGFDRQGIVWADRRIKELEAAVRKQGDHIIKISQENFILRQRQQPNADIPCGYRGLSRGDF